jgi:hypothetical protein
VPELELAGEDEPDDEPDDDRGDEPDGDPDEAAFSLAAGLLSAVLFVSAGLESVDELPDPPVLEA